MAQEPPWLHKRGPGRVMAEMRALAASNLLPGVGGLEPVDDDVMVWRLRVSKFDEDVPEGRKLNDDLETLGHKYGAQHAAVVLELRFPDDYPAAPFFLRVVRPRMVLYSGHVTAGGSGCIEALTQSGGPHAWRANMTVESVLVMALNNMLTAETVLITTPTGPGGLAGPLRIAMELGWRVKMEYSLEEAQQAFHRTAAAHGWAGGGGASRPPAPPAPPEAAAALAAAQAAALQAAPGVQFGPGTPAQTPNEQQQQQQQQQRPRSPEPDVVDLVSDREEDVVDLLSDSEEGGTGTPPPRQQPCSAAAAAAAPSLQPFFLQQVNLRIQQRQRQQEQQARQPARAAPAAARAALPSHKRRHPVCSEATDPVADSSADAVRASRRPCTQAAVQPTRAAPPAPATPPSQQQQPQRPSPAMRRLLQQGQKQQQPRQPSSQKSIGLAGEGGGAGRWSQAQVQQALAAANEEHGLGLVMPPEHWEVSAELLQGTHPLFVDLPLPGGGAATAGEAERVLQAVEACAGLGVQRSRVARIERVQHLLLWSKYARRRAKVARETRLGSANEQQLFHGATQATLASICNEGLDTRKASPYGVLGVANYFAASSCYSSTFSQAQQYAANTGAPDVAGAHLGAWLQIMGVPWQQPALASATLAPASATAAVGNRPAFLEGGHAMLLCNVILGGVGEGQLGQREPQLGCHSAALPGPPGCPGIVGVYDNAQAYPAYVIHYRGAP